MRVVLCTTTYLPELNGQAIFTANLAHGLAARGHQVWVVRPGTALRFTQISDGNVKVICLPAVQLSFIHKDLRLAVSYRRLLQRLFEQIHPDVVHVQDPSPFCQSAVREARQRSIPTIATHHPGPEISAPYFARLPLPFKRGVEAIGWRFVARHLNRADAVSVPSRSSAQMLAAHGIRRPAQPVSCGIRLSEFTPPSKVDREQILRGFGLPADRVIGLYVGRVDVEKRVDVLIEALATLPDEQVHLAIAGSGASLPQIRRLIQKRGLEHRVHLLGNVPHEHLPALISASDIFLMPGDAESFSIATLEAMACGKPVLAAHASALPELVTHLQNGYLFQPKNPQSAAEGLKWLLENRPRWAEMGQISLRRAEQHRLENTLTRYENLYRQTRPQTAVQPGAVPGPHRPAFRPLLMLAGIVFVLFSLLYVSAPLTASAQVGTESLPPITLESLRRLIILKIEDENSLYANGGLIQALLEKGESVQFVLLKPKHKAEDTQPSSEGTPSTNQPDAISARERIRGWLDELGIPPETVDIFEIEEDEINHWVQQMREKWQSFEVQIIPISK
ncbi:glycosyltransferase [Bellilinea caldifistulae]|uniref:glycosyltransferase n=1 Tax=Bellilinea caldifistulae TaxID=360411 RepID=UPI000780EB2B|nr:glycosyltransferase [Bellilinea caldifistulae]GAP09267.1 glycosyltransferase [Bellilinea caldifistulae]